MGFPNAPFGRGPVDIRLLPGDSAAVRGAAVALDQIAGHLQSARAATARLGDVVTGELWSGEAWAVFVDVVGRRPLPRHLDNAETAMAEAAHRLRWFADEFDRNQRRLRWCRTRLRNLGLTGGDAFDGVPPEVQAELARIQRTADDAHRDHRAALRQVEATFDRLDDRTMFATPPPSTLERVRDGAVGVVAFTGDVIRGAAIGVWEMGEIVAWAVVHLNPATLPATVQEAWQHRDEVVAILRYAREHPGEFATELGKSVLDWDTLTDDGFGVWLGQRIPDLLVTFGTAGVGRVATSASAATRALRVIDRADDATDAVRDGLGLGRRLRVAPPGGAGADVVEQAPALTRALSDGDELASSSRFGVDSVHTSVSRVGDLRGGFDDLSEAAAEAGCG